MISCFAVLHKHVALTVLVSDAIVNENRMPNRKELGESASISVYHLVMTMTLVGTIGICEVVSGQNCSSTPSRSGGGFAARLRYRNGGMNNISLEY